MPAKSHHNTPYIRPLSPIWGKTIRVPISSPCHSCNRVALGGTRGGMGRRARLDVSRYYIQDKPKEDGPLYKYTARQICK